MRILTTVQYYHRNKWNTDSLFTTRSIKSGVCLHLCCSSALAKVACRSHLQKLSAESRLQKIICRSRLRKSSMEIACQSRVQKSFTKVICKNCIQTSSTEVIDFVCDHMWSYVTIHDWLIITTIFLVKVFSQTVRNMVLKYFIFFFFQSSKTSSQEIFKSFQKLKNLSQAFSNSKLCLKTQNIHKFENNSIFFS